MGHAEVPRRGVLTYLRHSVPSLRFFRLYLDWNTDEEGIRHSLSKRKLFFVLGMGRSGTTFLAHLLNKSDGATVVNEPLRDDFRAHQQAFRDPSSAFDYIRKIRLKDIHDRIKETQCEVYGEVNSTLRRHAEALQEVLPNAVLVHLVRDGRDVVRSMLAHGTMSFFDPNTRKIQEVGKERPSVEWSKMDRFERLCWYWTVENRFLRQAISHRVKFEHLINDYAYFRENLLDPLGLELPRESWASEINQPKNKTKNHVLPHWSEWGRDRRESFVRICGDEMERSGYRTDSWVER